MVNVFRVTTAHAFTVSKPEEVVRALSRCVRTIGLRTESISGSDWSEEWVVLRMIKSDELMILGTIELRNAQILRNDSLGIQKTSQHLRNRQTCLRTTQ